jgi:hypothetical protein
MNTQEKLTHLINLGLEIKAEAEKKFHANCHHQTISKEVGIYFDGYNAFMVQNKTLELCYWYKPVRVAITDTDLDSVFDKAIADFVDANDIIKGMESMKDEQKEERRKYLLKELESLDNNNI